MLHIPRPALVTLTTRPSWHNRAGRTDRSACAELTVRHARTLAQKAGVNDAAHLHVNRTRVRLTITAHDLYMIHRARSPFVLQGDHRTPKSNAMQSRDESRGASSTPLSPRERAGVRERSTHSSSQAIAINPNAGACRDKILGLPAKPVEWSQQITLICPARAQRERAQRNSHDNPIPTANNYFLLCPICSKRVRKLFLPLCTEQEALDAHLAHHWLSTWEAHIRPHMTDLYTCRNTLITRYAPLFPPRMLACRTCLALRYGEVKSLNNSQ